MSPPNASERPDVFVSTSQSSGGHDLTNRLYISAYDGGSNAYIAMLPRDRELPKYFPTIDPDDPIITGGGWKHPGRDPFFPREPLFPIKDPDRTEPTECERKDAEKKLDKQISGLIPECDKKNLEDANHALLNGDTKALTAVLEKYKDDPAKLKAFTDEMNRELKDSHAGVGIHTTDDGKVEVYRDNGHRSVEIDPKTGETCVRKIMVGPDGNVFVGDKEPDACPNQVMEHIADRAVNNIEDPLRGIFTRGWDRDPIWRDITDKFRHMWNEPDYQIRDSSKYLL